MSSARREVLSKASIAIGGSLLFVAGFTVATARGALDPGQFAGRLAASLDDERVARYVGDRLTDVVVAQKPDLIAVRPVIHSTMTAVVQSEPFRGVVRTAARSTHRAILEQGGRRVLLSLPDIGILLRSALQHASPALAAKVPPDLEARLVAAAAFGDPALRGVAQGVWRAFYGNLRLAGLAIAAAGLLLAAMGGAVLEAADPVRRALDLVRRLSQVPAQPPARFARALALFIVGAAIVIWPVEAAALAAAAGGLALAFVALRELSSLAGSVSPAAGTDRPRRWPAWVAAALATSAAGGALTWFARGGGTRTELAGLPQACNGAAALCGRRVDQVVFPGAHNAMSNAEIDEWMFPHHEHAIARQLQDGVRALLIDVHYGIRTGGRVKTDLDREGVSREEIEKAIGPEATAAAVRIRDRLVGGKDGDRGIYLCHGFCELGAYEIGPTLRAIREFLVQHPGEVVIVIFEDYVTPADLARPFAESGLLNFVYEGATAKWPTLHELISRNQRLIVFAESGRPGLAWLHPAFEAFQETPYTFRTAAEMTCRPNRGGTAGSLFQVNHWIETTPTPRPSNAAVVNAYDFLLSRARLCQRERRRLPNLVAVDFYATGDLLRAVRTLNGLEDDSGPGKPEIRTTVSSPIPPR